MSHIVIDLGEIPDQPVALVARRPPVPYRAVLGVLSVVLLALLAGASARHRPAAPVVIPARIGDTTLLDGERMFLVGTGGVDTGSAVRTRTITTYHLPDVRETGRTAVAVAGTVVSVDEARNTIVVGYQLDASGAHEVVAQTVGSDRPLWRRPARLIGISEADGIALVSEEGGDAAIDLTTGALRWQVVHPRDGFVAETGLNSGYPDWLVVLTDSGGLETWDAHTGRRIAAGTAAAVTDRITGVIWPVSDLLLVADGNRGFDGMHLPDLKPLWHTPIDLSQSWLQSDCGTVVCTYRQRRGMTVLDPATGQLLWDSDRWAYAEPFGKYLLATPSGEEGDQSPLWVLDPRTGKVLGDFGAWQGLGPAAGGLVYGKREVLGKYQVFYGLLDPATRSVRLLGRGDRVSGGCETSAGVMVCRLIDASVAVWRLE